MENETISAHIKKLSENDWGKLFALTPKIESTKEFVKGGEIIEDDNDPESFVITPIIEDKVVWDFECIMYELDLVIDFNWPHWDDGREIVGKGNYSNLDTITLLKILTSFIRNNRFCDGALAERFEDRTIEKILRLIEDNIKNESGKDK